jgi:3'-5' exoribonuclease
LTKKLTEFQNDEEMELFVLIKSAEKRVTKAGKDFISMVFQDRSGDIHANYWDAKEDDLKQFQAGEVVFLKGKRETYKNAPQIKIMAMRLATAEEPDDPTLYTEKAPVSVEKLREAFGKLVFEINNPDWNRVVRYLLKKYDREFFTFPAAKSNHHAFEGGLAFHTLSIVNLGKSVASQYEQVDESLLIAGAILHDLGKTIELSGPIATKYTVEGNLLGHIVIVDEEIVTAAKDLKIDPSSESMVMLRHMIVSHHGLKEYGSPMEPHMLEAVILHALDELDAEIQMVSGALKNVAPGNFSERIFGMDGRNFYKPESK